MAAVSLRLLLAALTLLSACAAPRPPGAGETARLLVGVWCNPSDDGAGCWAYDEFRADGGFTACGIAQDDPVPFRGSGRYAVDGQRMCYVVTHATPNFWLPTGARYCTEIVAIDRDTHRYRDIDTDAEFRLTRVVDGSARCPAPASPGPP